MDAVKKIVLEVRENKLSVDEVTQESIVRNLYQPSIPDPDLLIRTGGEQRISNFLLWQVAYAELYFTDVFWPEFDTEQLDLALDWYHSRERKFGRV